MPDRRSFLTGSALLAAAPAVSVPTEGIAADLDRYIGFGNKQAGGPGDTACGAWLAGELERAGYAVQRQDVATPFFTPDRAELVCGAAKAPVWPQPIVIPTGAAGVSGRLVYVDPRGHAHGPLAGAVALVDLPASRWSTALAKPVREPVAAAFAAGAKAVVVVTNGPTGKVIALNADGRKPMFAGPVALLAPDDAAPFADAAARGESATLFVTGTGGHRPAFNLVGRIDRGAGRWLAVSTPRSGWTSCAGERGGGVAVWLALARWASRAVQGHDLAFICNSGHEYEYLGAAEAMKAIAPAPAKTRFWLHLGANVAAQDWHEGTGKPLPSIDPQRFLALSPELLPLAREVFAGHVGYEAPYSSAQLAAGELVEVIAAGFKPAAGVFGIHRYHHVDGDDARCVSARNVATTAAAFQAMVTRVLAGA
jgi:hypothetical protein